MFNQVRSEFNLRDTTRVRNNFVMNVHGINFLCF